MAFENYICEVTNKPVSPANCLICARNGTLPGCTMTAPVIKGITKNMRPDDFGLTVTTLLGCARKVQLRQEWPYNLKPSELWWSFRGQLMHNISAEYVQGDLNAIAEKRFSLLVEAGGKEFAISGAPDLVYLDRRHLVDYKTIKAVPGPWRAYACPVTGLTIREGSFAWRQKMIPCPFCEQGEHNARQICKEGAPRARGKHVEQVSLYRLILAENGIEVDTAEIIYMDMSEQLRIPVELLSLDDAWKLVGERLALHTAESLPDIVRTADDLWECDFCAVKDICERLYGSPVGKVLLEEEGAGVPD